jgi:hypothetical protein
MRRKTSDVYRSREVNKKAGSAEAVADNQVSFFDSGYEEVKK